MIACKAVLQFMVRTRKNVHKNSGIVYILTSLSVKFKKLQNELHYSLHIDQKKVWTGIILIEIEFYLVMNKSLSKMALMNLILYCRNL